MSPTWQINRLKLEAVDAITRVDTDYNYLYNFYNFFVNQEIVDEETKLIKE
jgi:hypothetical protein